MRLMKKYGLTYKKILINLIMNFYLKFEFRLIDVEETNIITSLKNKSSFGYNLIPTK